MIILSRTSTFDDYDDEVLLEEACEERTKIKNTLDRRRLLKFLAIVLAFLVVGFILLWCVIHDVKQREDIQFKEFSCAASDSPCLLLLCPTGMIWRPEKDQCQSRWLGMGVSPNNPSTCAAGLVWIEWRRKCMRRAW